jgi:hypothetical protein
MLPIPVAHRHDQLFRSRESALAGPSCPLHASLEAVGLELDCASISDDDRGVVDDRVPGNSVPKMQKYKCDHNGCTYTEWSETVPECPNHGTKMSPMG